jgi:hypothetical protein
LHQHGSCRADIRVHRLWRLIAEAYGQAYQLRRFEIVGIPDAIASPRFKNNLA